MPCLAIFAAFRAWGFWGVARDGLAALRRWLISDLWRLACALALVALVAQSIRMESQRHRADKAEVTLAQVKPAQAAAAAAQAAVNHHPAAISAAIAEKSDAQAPAYYRSVSAAADLHSLHIKDPRSVSPASLRGADNPPALDDRPAAPADLVCRPTAEDGQIVNAAARAAQMRADAQELIRAGVARAEEQGD